MNESFDREVWPGEEDVSSALAATMGTLPAGALDDFLRWNETRADQSPAGDGYVVFICAVRRGSLAPLKSVDLEHPLWRQILEAAGARIRPDTGLLLAHHLVLTMGGGPEQPARILAIPDAAILQALRVLDNESPLSGSELRLLKQLLCGLNLREAATRDRVSHETKRTQYKSLARKLGAHSQNELTGKTLARILLDLTTNQAAPASGGDRLFVDLAREFMPDARTVRLHGASGADHRFLDVGPLDGRPVVFVHSQILPDLRPHDIGFLHERKLRFIFPLRNGAMTATPGKLGVKAHLDHACEAIDLARSHFCGERADLLLCISGCAYGIDYARRHPERVRSAAFVGACVKPNTGTSTAGRLRSGMFALAARHWGLYSRAIDFYGRRVHRPDTLRRLLLDVYRPCLADLEIVKAEYAPPHGGERVRKMFSTSIESMKHDFYHQRHPRWAMFPAHRFPATFFHGSHDFIHAIGDVRDLAKSFGDIPVHPIQGGGQLLYHRHFEPLVAAYEQFLGPDRSFNQT